MKKPELVLICTGPAESRWQSSIPIDEIPRRLRETAERLEEQIADGRYDKQLALVAR